MGTLGIVLLLVSVIAITGNVANGSVAKLVNKRPQLRYCTYNGRRYSQGATWRDGCRYNCVCYDASRGAWSCNQICLNWSGNILRYCDMITPRGKCCQEPQCPSWLTAVYPQGWVNPDVLS